MKIIALISMMFLSSAFAEDYSYENYENKFANKYERSYEDRNKQYEPVKYPQKPYYNQEAWQPRQQTMQHGYGGCTPNFSTGGCL